MPIRHLIFDLGNVLIDLDMAATEQRLQALLGDHFRASFARNEQEGLFEAFEKGLISEADFFAELRRLAKAGTTVEELKDAWNAMLLGFPLERLLWVEHLRKRGCHTYVLSNTNVTHLEWVYHHLDAEYGISNYEQRFFDKVWYSHQLHLRKPEPEIYRYVLEDAGLDPAETLFVDDNPANVAAARAAGIRALRNPPGTDVRQTLAPVLGELTTLR